MHHNPFVNLQELTEAQIEGKISELQRKYFMTYNLQVQMQIANMLDIYKDELRTRQALAAQKQRQQMQENGDNDLDSLINIS
jgi:DNA-directed RNA polymerase specialized sigma24 family protein